jgi:DNA-binding SARP family transcriptional activator
VGQNDRVTDPERPTVLRGRLLGRLARRHDRRVIMVIAGAGFGKTTVVRQMLCDPAPGPATVDVVVSLRTPAPDADGLVQVLADAVFGQPVEGVDVDRLVDLIWARSPEQVAVIIDDVHLLDAGSSAVLRELHDRLPHNGHLVLVGRRAPFALQRRALVDGSADVLGEDDLAFDDDELSAFERLRGQNGTTGSTSDPTRWPALLELERASGQSGVVQYLVEELLFGLDPDLLAVLRRLALHSSVDDELIAALTVPGDEDDGTGAVPRPSLSTVVDALPMTAWSDGGSCIVVHDLVREALVSDLDDGDRRWALGRIATVLAARGDHAAAVRLYDLVGDIDAIEGIARRLVDDLYMRDSTDLNRQLLAALRQSLGQHLVLDTIDAVLTLLDHPDRARPMLERAAERARAAGDEALETLCVLRLADDAYCAADHEALEGHAARLHELADAGSPSARRLSFVADVWCLSLAGRHGEVVELVDRVVYTDGPEQLDPEIRDYARFSWVIHRAYSGHIVDALDAIDAKHAWELPDGLYANRLAGFALVQRWQLGQLTADQRAAAVVLVDRIEAMGQVALFVEGAATTALFHASAGDVATATSLLERAERQVPRLPASAWPIHTVAQCRAVLEVMAGDEPSAAATLRAGLPERGVAGLPRFVYGATAALSYLLLPETRSVWDGEPCGPDHLLRLHVAHALVALRDRGDSSLAASLPWDDLARLRTWAYEPHLAELAVAALEAGTERAAAALDDLRHDPRRHLEALVGSADAPFARRAAAALRAVPRRPDDALRVNVLGAMTLRRTGVPIDDDVWTRRQRVRDLFGLLVHHRAINRATLAEAIWPDKTLDAAAGNLRYTLNQLLGVIEPHRDAAGPAWYVRSVGQQLVLVVDSLLVLDVDEFRSAMAAARVEDASGAPGRALDRYRAAIDAYAGPYLAGVSDDRWGYLERLGLQGDLVEAVSRSVDLLVAANELGEAERLAAKGVEVEPLNEHATGALVKVLLQRRRIGAAREVVSALLDELATVGMSPEPGTLDLVARLGIESSIGRTA